MVIEELKTYGATELKDLDILMNELSSDSFCSTDKLNKVLLDDNSHLFVVRKEACLIATATLCICHTPEFTIGCVEAVVVSSMHRGEGLGRGLMKYIIEKSREYGCAKIHLTSNPKRVAANGLYQSIGFEKCETNYYELVI